MALVALLCLSVLAAAQTISTSTPVPPLQWLNLTPLLQGSDHPPPLKDAAIGYDETSRSLIIFGGESENGFPQAQTFLLNLQSLTWSTPSPPPTLSQSPPARSAMISAVDFAASNRHAFVVIGGKGSNGKALSDVWEFDFINQFWSPVQLSSGGPSPRWGASGGADIRTSPIQDPIVPGPNNTVYLAGGFDGKSLNPLSDLWRLNLSGTLSSNLPDNSRGSWERLSINTLPSTLNSGSTVIGQHVVSAGGCSVISIQNDTCALQDSFVLNVQLQNSISPGACPAPRLSPALAPNLNAFSTSFTSQVFMLLGTFNSSLWDDGGGLEKGEVAVLDINTGTWSRVLPAGDPGTSGKVSFPTPREGAAALSFTQSLVGQSRNSSDTIIFGGRDASGNYLSEIWLLRAYPGSVTTSDSKWAGFGDGQLKTGVDADGSGVQVQYITSCVSAIASKPTSSTSRTSSAAHPSSTSTPTGGPPSREAGFEFDTHLLHKLLAPLSLAIFLPIILFYRLVPERRAIWSILLLGLTLGTYGIGVAGLVLSFTTLSSATSLVKRSTSAVAQLKTAHGRAGLALFVCCYVVAPMIWLLSAWRRRVIPSTGAQSGLDPVGRNNDENNSEKLDHVPENSGSNPQSIRDASPPASPRPRTLSWGPSSLWRRSHEGAMSSDSESITSAGPTRAFEVLNRPARTRHLSNDMTLAPPQTRSLGEIDWLLRRRSLNAVNELDYAISQAHHAQLSATNTGDALMTPTITPTLQQEKPTLPSIPEAIFHVFVHGSILGLCIFSLIALWQRAPRAIFAVFLLWTVIFYTIKFGFAWKGYPKSSILSAIFSLRRSGANEQTTLQSTAHSPSPQLFLDRQQGYIGHGPYTHHRPPYNSTPLSPDELSISYGDPRTVEEDDDADIDDDTRQRMIEEEMGRRDVSIVTVPKRKLWVANPS